MNWFLAALWLASVVATAVVVRKWASKAEAALKEKAARLEAKGEALEKELKEFRTGFVGVVTDGVRGIVDAMGATKPSADQGGEAGDDPASGKVT
jgi:hypothetical protein